MLFCCILPSSSFSTLTPKQSNTSLETMELCVQGYDDETKYVIEVGENDTTETMRQKVASATGLCEDSFRMGFGGKEEGEDITELSAGDTVVLTKTTKYEAISALHALGETNITAERLQQVEDPKVASLLLQAEVATEIPEEFFSGSDVTRIGFSCVPNVDDNCGITLHLPALPCVTTIGYGFLCNCKMLSEVDFTGLQAVTTIGDRFLSNCETLSKVDFTGMQSVTTIGDDFLSDCTSLSEVDFTGLQAVTTIGDRFLSNCTTLSKVDFTGMQSVTTIGGGFLYNCTSLSEVDFTGLQAVTTIGYSFLSYCTSLSKVDFTGLQAVTTIGDYFLSNCTSLSEVDFTGLQAVTTIGYRFLSNCRTLSKVDGLDKCSNVVRSRLGDVGF